MPAWLLALLPKALELLVGLFVKKPPAPDLSRELGRAEQQNADMKEGTAIQRRATEAAKRVEEEEGGYDENDRDNRR